MAVIDTWSNRILESDYQQNAFSVIETHTIFS